MHSASPRTISHFLTALLVLLIPNTTVDHPITYTNKLYLRVNLHLILNYAYKHYNTGHTCYNCIWGFDHHDLTHNNALNYFLGVGKNFPRAHYKGRWDGSLLERTINYRNSKRVLASSMGVAERVKTNVGMSESHL